MFTEQNTLSSAQADDVMSESKKPSLPGQSVLNVAGPFTEACINLSARPAVTSRQSRATRAFEVSRSFDRDEPMPQLAITVSLRPGETLISFVSHLAAANGILSVLEFCKDVGLSWSSLRQGRKEELVRLSELSGVPTETLKRAANVSIGSLDYMLSGQQVTRKSLVQYETIAGAIRDKSLS